MRIRPDFVVPYAQELEYAKADAQPLAYVEHPMLCRDLGFDGRQTVDSTRVLIVDTDIPRCRDIAAMIQTIGGLEVFVAHSSHDVLTIATECLPGFVLFNTDLAELECYRLAILLQQSVALCDSRLIALTTDITSMDRRAARSAGFELFLTLPLKQFALESILMGRSHRGPERSCVGERGR